MSQYFLPAHVHVGYRQGALVFLDLKSDDYTLVDGAVAAEFLKIVSNERGAARNDTDVGDVRALCELLDAGLLTTDSNRGRRVAITKRDPVVATLTEVCATDPAPITVIDSWHFAASCVTAAWQLRFQEISSIVTGILRRKSSRRASLEAMDVHAAREATAKFIRLRYLFPRNYVCLYDSLALIEFLARYRVFPDWVFGVTLEPWGAHCWVQGSGYVFNEEVEEVANYTPIMSV